MQQYWVYILCSKKNGTLYVGSTSNLPRRIYEHQQSLVPGFTKDHAIKHLVYAEEHATMYNAATREKRIKSWHRAWKIQLVEMNNQNWDDLSLLFL